LSASALRALCSILLIGCLFVLPGPSAAAQEAYEPNGTEPVAATSREWEHAIFLGEPITGPDGPVSPGTSPAGAVLQMVLVLALVAVAIYGLVYLLKKASQGNRAAKDPFLKVLASAHMGANRGVHVVSLGSQTWLVGAAEHGVNLIGEITDREVVDAMLLEDSRRSAESITGRLPNFKAMLRRLGMPADPDPSTPENIRKRSERLKGM